MKPIARNAAPLLLASLAASAALAQPDAAMTALTPPFRGGNSSPVGQTSYSIGATTCNIGDALLPVLAGSANHPVFVQNIYRLKDGRFQQVGMSWALHEFCALQQAVCSACTPGSGCEAIGIGCSSPDSASYAGQRSALGARSQVNASTGAFSVPYAIPPVAFPAGRIAVDNTDLDPAMNPGALYFSEVIVNSPSEDDRTNNASHRRILVGTFTTNGWNLANHGVASQVDREPAITSWAANSPGVPVTLTQVDVPGDGRFIVASAARSLGSGVWRYEYAVLNLSSHRSLGMFDVPAPAFGVTVANTGFASPAYHSGEPYSSAPWELTHLIGNATDRWQWATEPFATNANANALRWGTVYNFHLDADAPPADGEVNLGLFRPGSPESLTAAAVVPSFETCAADLDHSGQADVPDIFAFLALWFANDPAADFDGSGLPVDVPDIFAFLAAWFAGCP